MTDAPGYYMPLVSASELGTYLGIDNIDTARAEQILSLAQGLCESVVSPLPDAAKAVVLDVAAAAWTNPTSANSQTTGPFSATFAGGVGGLRLTRAHKATLRRLAGSGGAFTIDTLPATAGTNLPWWDAGGVDYNNPDLIV